MTQQGKIQQFCSPRSQRGHGLPIWKDQNLFAAEDTDSSVKNGQKAKPCLKMTFSL